MPQLSWIIYSQEEYPISMRYERFSNGPNTIHMILVFQIFELEGQLDSALDTYDQGAPAPQGHARTGSMRRARGSMGSNTHPRIPSQSSRKPDSSPGPQTRPRVIVTPSLTRPAETTVQASPLAQLFQPLIVDEVIPEDAQPNVGTREGVSYGPVSRRRLSSATTLQRVIPPSREGDSTSALVHSPEQRSESLQPETAEETEEKESTLGNLELSRRLDSIEERQRRIEDLLVEVVGRMRGSASGGSSEGSVTV